MFALSRRLVLAPAMAHASRALSSCAVALAPAPDVDAILRGTPSPFNPVRKRERPKPVPAARHGMTVEVFLQRIGKGCEAHIDKFKSWDELFSLRGIDMKKRDIPVQQRRWILRKTELYRQNYDP